MKYTNQLNKNFDLSKINQLHEDLKKDQIITQTTNTFSETTINKIIEEITTNLTLPEIELAWILIAGVLQRGGSNLKAGNAVSYTIGTYTLSSQQLNKIIRKFVKNGTNRQLARTIANEIADIALTLNIPGDLHSQMLIEHPKMSDQDKVWCSNFQTQNPNCPDHIREWLVKNYKSRFSK